MNSVLIKNYAMSDADLMSRRTWSKEKVIFRLSERFQMMSPAQDGCA